MFKDKMNSWENNKSQYLCDTPRSYQDTKM